MIFGRRWWRRTKPHGVPLADVSPGLIEAIEVLFDEYGPLGVEQTVIEMRARMTT